MSEAPVFWVGNRNPSITDVITDEAGVPINLTGLSVRFKAREVGTTALLVDQPVSNTLDATGTVRYDWSAADITVGPPVGILSGPRRVLVWWEVTASGKTQDVNEAVIEIRAHAPQSRAYVELEELKSTLELTGTQFAEDDIRNALVAASRGIDELVGRRFYEDADANKVRYYSGSDVRDRHRLFWDGFEFVPDLGRELRIDDLVSLTKLETDNDGDGTYENTWTQGTDFVLDPLDAQADERPYRMIRVLRGSSYRLPSTPDSIKLTGQFGWPAIPAGIKQATTIIATRLLRRAREAPFGVVSIGLDGMAVRAASVAHDPDILFLLEPYMRRRLLA